MSQYKDKCKTETRKLLGIFNISRAHFMPKAERELYIEIPKEGLNPEDGDALGRLNRNMYGFRDASNAGFRECKNVLFF